MEQVVILHLANESGLLEPRSPILKQAGYVVVPVFSVELALRTFAAGDFDVVLLCHSIPSSERAAFIGFVRKHSPSTPVVLISNTRIESTGGYDATVENDPEKLLRKLPLVLNQHRVRVMRSD